MKVKITPTHLKPNSITIPPSKSLAHRAIICACLAPGKSVITNIDYSVDIRATLEGMRHLGARIEEQGNTLIIDGSETFHYDHEIVNCQESGSTLRFFLPIFSLTGEQVRFEGSERLMTRPQTVYEQLFRKQGIRFERNCPHITLEGTLTPGEFTLQGNISSQFITGLLFALPLLDGDSIIHIEPPFESCSYVDLTLYMLGQFMIQIQQIDDLTYRIPGNQTYLPADISVEGDYSQLIFWAALGALNCTVETHGLDPFSWQGDRKLIEIMEQMGATIFQDEDGFTFYRSTLHGTTIDLNDCPDLGPMLFALATQAHGTTTFTHAERLRIKESDRIEAMELELRKLGCEISSTYDTVTIQGPTKLKGNVSLHGHNDHRIVMALSILGTIAEEPIIIDDAQAIRKSYPGFFDDLMSCDVCVDLFEEEHFPM